MVGEKDGVMGVDQWGVMGVKDVAHRREVMVASDEGDCEDLAHGETLRFPLLFFFRQYILFFFFALEEISCTTIQMGLCFKV